MPKLTNSYQRCELLNLGYGPKGRGPFIVRQDGYPAGSMIFKEDRFLLRKDGTWVLNLAVFPLTESQKEQFLYETSVKAMAVLNGLTGEPVVEEGLPPDTSLEELKVAAETTIQTAHYPSRMNVPGKFLRPQRSAPLMTPVLDLLCHRPASRRSRRQQQLTTDSAHA